MRKEKVKQAVTTGKICRKTDRGRQGDKILDNLLSWNEGVPAHQLNHAVVNRWLLRSIIAHTFGNVLDDDEYKNKYAILNYGLKKTYSAHAYGQWQSMGPYRGH